MDNNILNIKDSIPSSTTPSKEVFQEVGIVKDRIIKISNICSSIGKKVEIITRLRKIFEEPNGEGMELIQQFEEEFQKILSSFPDNIIHDFNEFKNLKNQLNELNKQKEIFYKKVEKNLETEDTEDEENTEDISKEYDDLDEKETKLVNLLSEYEKKADVMFLFSIYEGLKKLREKGEEFEKEKEKYYKDGKWNTTSYIKNEGLYYIDEISSFGLSINHIINKGIFQDIYGKIGGFHETDSIFNIIINRSKDNIQSTISHENSHNYYEAFCLQEMLSTSRILSNLKRMTKLIQIGAPDNIIEDNIKLLKKKPLLFINFSQGEIIANFNNLLEGKMSTELTKYKKLEKEIDEEIKNIEEKDKKLLLQEFSKKLKGIFHDFYSSLGDLMYIAQKFGIQEEMKSIMMLYRPSQYYKIFRFLSHKYGKNKISALRSIRLLIKEPFFVTDYVSQEEQLANIIFGINSFGNVKGVTNKISAFSFENLSILNENIEGNIKLDENEKEAISNSLSNCKFDFIVRNFPEQNLDTYYQYIEMLTNIFQKLGISISDDQMEDIFTYLMSSFYKSCIDDGNIKIVSEYFQKFSGKYKKFIKIIANELKMYFDESCSLSQQKKDKFKKSLAQERKKYGI